MASFYIDTSQRLLTKGTQATTTGNSTQTSTTERSGREITRVTPAQTVTRVSPSKEITEEVPEKTSTATESENTVTNEESSASSQIATVTEDAGGTVSFKVRIQAGAQSSGTPPPLCA